MKLVFFIVLLFLYTNCYKAYTSEIPKVKQGVLDISRFDFTERDSLSLNGDWEFFWNQLIDPKEIPENLEVKRTGFIAPGLIWEDQVVNGTLLHGTGYATYKLTILFPESSLGKLYGLKFSTTGGPAYKILMNETLIGEFGKVGILKETMVATRIADSVMFTVTEKRMNLYIQISNFHHASGTFWYAPELNTYKQITSLSKRKQAVDAFLFGSIFIMGLYHLSFYIYRKKDKSSLYFGIFCLSISIYLLNVNEVFLYTLFPTISYQLAHSLLVIFYLLVPFYLSFLYTLFPDDFSKNLIRIFCFISFVCFLFALFTPTEIGTIIEAKSILYILLILSYTLIGVTKATYRKRKNSSLIFFANLLIVLSVFNDMLSMYNYIETPLMLSYAIFGFILVQSNVLSKNFSKAFTEVENLSDELKKLNESLELTVELRTIQFKTEKEKAEDANQWKDKFITLVSHDLRSPLSSILGLITLIEEDESLSKEEEKYYLKQARIILLNSISNVKHLLNLSRFNSGTLIIEYCDFAINEIINDLIDDFQMELDRKKINLENLIPPDTIFTADEKILQEILRNLILNAIKFSNEHGTIRLEYDENPNFQVIIISDTGVGMSDFVKRNLFQSEVTTNGTLQEKGFGVGLKLCSELIQLHRGLIEFESTEGIGTKFFLRFPSNKNIVLVVWKREVSLKLKELLDDRTRLYIRTISVPDAIKLMSKISFRTLIIDTSFTEEEKEEIIRIIHNLDMKQERKIVFI